MMKFSKVRAIVDLYSKWHRKLTFENFTFQIIQTTFSVNKVNHHPLVFGDELSNFIKSLIVIKFCRQESISGTPRRLDCADLTLNCNDLNEILSDGK